MNTANTVVCDDGNACTAGDVCSNGTCAGTLIVCNDSNFCTNDSCNPAAGCVFAVNTTVCDDTNSCTVSDICSGGTCGGTPMICDSPPVVECLPDNLTRRTYAASGVCADGVCEYALTDTVCDDGSECTSDTCSGGACVYTPVVCNDSVACTADSCDRATGCVFTPEDIACNDGNLCTDDSCDGATGCVNASNTVVCNDGDACTVSDVCSGGNCSGTPMTCDSPPADECVAGPAVRAYDSAGACANGVCDYGFTDTICPSRDNAVATCSAATCRFTCNSGYGNCDAVADNGCETAVDANNEDCGSDCTVCTNFTQYCVLEDCRVCGGTSRDCNDDPTDGCEINTVTDLNNCGECGNVCTAPADATATCSVSVCGFSCNLGYERCESQCCAVGYWVDTSITGVPSARNNHRAVWTGSEMIIWGGTITGGETATGSKYDPDADTWSATTLSFAPTARLAFSAVWGAERMIIWGGDDIFSGSYVNTGSRYDPVADDWDATTTLGSASARNQHTAVWSGSEMIVWGGNVSTCNTTTTGGRYDPIANSWLATSTSGAPIERRLHTAVWSGTSMLIWGGRRWNGCVGERMNTGGVYEVSTDSWTSITTVGAPTARTSHTAVWTGTEMIIWGGYTASYVNTGGRYDPLADSWIPTTTIDAPSGRSSHTAVWTGSEMIVWGGYCGLFCERNTGARYDPILDVWDELPTTDAPAARYGHTAVWTDSEMVVWGGYNGTNRLNTGGRYTPPR